jgi:hypothetical protein
MTVNIIMVAEEVVISSRDDFYLSSCLQFLLDIIKDLSTGSCTRALEL